MGRALFAGVIATAIVSALIYVNVNLGFVPALDMLAEIRAFNARVGLPAGEIAAWVTHVVMGVAVYGIGFAVVRPILPGRTVSAGLVFGFVTFLVMMVSFMPLAGNALFAQDLGAPAVAAALILNLVYGGVLGATHGLINDGV